MALSSMTHNPLTAAHQPGLKRFDMARAQQQVVLNHLQNKTPKRETLLAESFSHLLHHLHIEPPSRAKVQHINWDLHKAAVSPREVISEKWHEIRGSTHWNDLSDPLHPWLRREIVKYGEFAQATYDAFDHDSSSEYCGSCRHNKNKLFDQLGLTRNGYRVTKYIYAMSHIELPRWLERSHVADPWSQDSNWMGYVAVSDDLETRRIGRRDIMVAWRGTVALCEWYDDFLSDLKSIGAGESKVEHGFLSIYTSKNCATRYNKSSASEQVMREVIELVQIYREKGEEVSLTITGHSLGGALALLNAHEAGATIPNLPITVISFGAPKVGNIAFREELHQMGVKTLRVVVKQDLVPKMPGHFPFNEGFQAFGQIRKKRSEWDYTHVGTELMLDACSSPYLKRGMMNFPGFHSLETYLHLVDGYLDSTTPFRADAKRDVALVNKHCDMLVNELSIPPCWYQLANTGLVCDSHGRSKPRRHPDDIPSPTREIDST
ncbi:hypothetical protein L6164_037196 [Bauhinia variegata]|uniref:Uncharacterized protein n=1 Tax=Bauhinia variegata TaxID=167791 RepID=A0ACB9KJI7_BAUVA|nr:hypothetical protein L6164_037196 [Bauhinia variegata]